MPRLTAYESPFQVTLKGVAAGLVGTLVMTSALQAAARLFGTAERDARRRPGRLLGRRRADGARRGAAGAADRAGRRAARQPGVSARALAGDAASGSASGIHWAYGAFWGALSAQLQLTLRPPALPYGVALGHRRLGGRAGAAGPGARPLRAAGLVGHRPGGVLAIGLHVLYGVDHGADAGAPEHTSR